MKKLEKYGIISQGTRHKAKSYHPHNITNEDILMLEYYSSI
jgi:hypothetical protein